MGISSNVHSQYGTFFSSLLSFSFSSLLLTFVLFFSLSFTSLDKDETENRQSRSADATRLALAEAGDGMEDGNYREKSATNTILRFSTQIHWIEVCNHIKSNQIKTKHRLLKKQKNNKENKKKNKKEKTRLTFLIRKYCHPLTSSGRVPLPPLLTNCSKAQ